MEGAEERKFIIRTNKNNEMELLLKNYNNEELSITLFNINEYKTKKYELKCNLEEFQKNRFFKIFININEIMKELENKIEKSIFLEDTNCIIIQINIGLTIINEILLIVEEQEKNKDEIVEGLEKYIKILENKLEDSENKIKKLNEEITKEKLTKIIEKKDSLDINSLIIKDYKKFLKNWINPNKNLSTKLLYRLSRDGEKLSKFHELCNDKGPTLTLFKVIDGNIGGIYTPLSWDNSNTWKHDMESFMFNLNKNKKYKKLKNENSIWVSDKFGPWSNSFGFLEKNQMKKIEHRGLCINEYYENGADILPNNSNNWELFDIVEVEVYEIL